MPPSIASTDSGCHQEPAGTNTPKPTQPSKRQRRDSTSSETSGEGTKPREHQSKKRKKHSKRAEPTSDSELGSIARHRDSEGSDSNDDEAGSAVVKRSVSAMEKRKKNKPEVELAACIERIKASKSDAYATFYYPTLAKPTKGLEYTHYTFKCKTCKDLVKRQIGSMETSALLGHKTRCDLKQKQQLLYDCGITGSSGPPTAYQVREYCALVICENARPQLMFKDRYLRHLFSRDVVKLLPHRTTMTQDIFTMYRMTQKHIATILSGIPGVFHIALDMYQTPNRFDYLGVVLFHQEVADRAICLKRFVLECLNFTGSHTGKALANKIYTILSKFEIQDRVWGVVCDNASNNGAMMERFRRFGMTRLEGPECRVHCLAHILNLAAQAILSDFVRRRAIGLANGELDDGAGGNDLDGSDDDDDDDVGLQDPNLFDEEDVDFEDDGTAPSHMLDPEEDSEDDGDDDWDAEIPEIEAGSEEEREFRAAKDVLLKGSWFANKLKRSPRTKADFKAICVEQGVSQPHNIRRDVKTRWNGTAQLLQDVERLYPAILAYQSAENYPRRRRFTREERKGVRVLLGLLQPLETLTKTLSRAGVPTLGSVLIHYDSLNHEYTSMSRDTNKPLYARRAAYKACKKFNKYYEKTDESIFYRLAILVSPSFRIHYLRGAEWPQEWIDTAVEILQEYWEKFYKPAGDSAEEVDAMSEYSTSSYMDRVCAQLDGMNAHKEANPITRFINGDPVFDRSDSGKSIPVNGLNWWHMKRLAGDDQDGLAQMAIDILTTPATSVDCERAFSFVSIMVSKRRHKLGAINIQASASLGAYSRADLVPPDCLKRAYKAKAKQKRLEAEKRAELEAEAIVLDDDDDDDDGGDGDKEDDEEPRSLPEKSKHSGSRKSSTSTRKASASSQKAPQTARKASGATRKVPGATNKASATSRKASTTSKR